MPRDQDQTPLHEATVLRRRAEVHLKTKTPEVDFSQSDGEARRLLHELQVHQIELVMQNVELRQARDQIEKSLEKYTELYDFAPVGYVTLDRDGTIGSANLTVAMLLGIERSRMLGQRFSRFVAAEARPAFTVFLGKIFTIPVKEVCEVALLKEGTSTLFVQIEAVATASGQECRAAIIDISARRQLEEKLELLHTDLAARAAELETANIELEAFNYSVSHDLRGPLNVITGYCDVIELLYGKQLEEKCREYLREMHEGTLRMNRLIDTLLNFSRVKRIAMHPKPVDLSRMAQEVALGLQVAEPARRVTFRIAAGVVADGDENLLRVVLDNLIGNAWKYIVQRDDPLIEFGVTDIAGKPAYFIRDNGPGFEMALTDKLFLPFQQLPGADVEGYGIGLATVDRIVRRHGGKVWAESKPGEGATFFFTLG